MSANPANIAATHRPAASVVRHQINWRLMMATLLVAALGIPAVWYWHGQSRRAIATSFLEQGKACVTEADQSQAAGDLANERLALNKAVDLFWQYRQIRPDDSAAAILLARTFDRSPQGRSNRQRTAQLYVDAVSSAVGDEQLDLQVRLGEVMLETGDFAATSAHAGQLVQMPEWSDPSATDFRARVATLRALALWPQRDNNQLSPGDLGSALAVAIASAPEDCRFPPALARLYRDPLMQRHLNEAQREALNPGGIGAAASADELVDAMIDRNRELAAAWLQRYHYRSEWGIDGAIDDLKRAGELNQKDSLVSLELGKHFLGEFEKGRSASRAGDNGPVTETNSALSAAERHFEEALSHDGNHFEAMRLLGLVRSRLGRHDEAIQVWNKALDKAKVLAIDVMEVGECHEWIVRTLIEHDRLDEAASGLEAYQSLVGRYSQARYDPRRLNQLVLAGDYLTALLKHSQGNSGEAIGILEGARTGFQRPASRLATDSLRLLGEIYKGSGNPEQAVNVYRAAIDLQSASSTRMEFSWQLAQALAEAGQFENAARLVEPLIQQSTSAAQWLQLASLEFESQRRLPESRRDWEKFEQAVARSRELNNQLPFDQAWRIDSLELQSSLVRDPASPLDTDAVARIEAAGDDTGTALADLARVLQQAGMKTEADRIVEKHRSLAGETAEHFVLEAELLASRGQADQARDRLTAGLVQVAAAEQLPLHLALVNLLFTEGHLDEAFARLEELAKQHPEHPRLLNDLANLFIQVPARIGVHPAEWESRLAMIEGPQGPRARMLAALRLLEAAKNLEDSNRREAELRQVASACRALLASRPNWPVVHALAGTVDIMLANTLTERAREQRSPPPKLALELLANARDSLRRAVELGERRLSVLMQLVDLETSPAAIRAILDLLDRKLLSADSRLSSLHTTLLMAGNELDHAREFARQTTEQRPGDVSAWLDLAWIELNSGEQDGARLAADQALSLASSSVDPRKSMLEVFFLYATASQLVSDEEQQADWMERARALVPKIVELSELHDRVRVEATMLAALDDAGAAATFRQAEESDPGNPAVLQAALDYRSSRNLRDPVNLNEAIRLARRLTEVSPDAGQHRMVLANLLTIRGSVEDWNEVTRVLGEKRESTGDSAEGRRIQAVILFAKRNVSNTERLENLEQAFELLRNGDDPADLVMAGQILRAWAELLTDDSDAALRAEKLAEAGQRLVAAGDAENVSSGQLYIIADFCIFRQQWEIADRYIRRLRDLAGNSLVDRAPVIALDARLKHGRGSGNREAIIADIEAFGQQVETEGRGMGGMVQARLYQQVAAMLDSIDASAEAIAWREKAARFSPEQRIRLAHELASHGEKDRAVKMCVDGYRDSAELQYATALADLLIVHDCSPEHFAAAETVFAEALKKYPDNVVLLTNLGNVRIAGEGRVREAISFYEQGLRIDPQNVLLLNNLATACAEIPDLPRALEVINLAIDSYGKYPELIDTKATIVMQQGHLDQAETLLNSIVNRQSDPRFWWHLAEVRLRKFEKSSEPADLENALDAWQRAVATGLENQVLTVSERRRLAEMKQGLAKQQRPSP